MNLDARCEVHEGTVLPWWSIEPYDLLLQNPAAGPITQAVRLLCLVTLSKG